MENIQTFFENFIEYFGPEKIDEIPSEYRSQKVWNIYMEKGGRLSEVPKKYRNRKIYDVYIETLGSRINIIPEKYLDQEMYDKYINKGGNILNVPEEFLNQEICDTYISKGGNILSVPKEFQNQELWIIYLEKGGELSELPEQYKTKSFYLELLKRKKLDFDSIPTEFLDQEIVNEYVKKSGSIAYIPKEYLNQDLVNYVAQSRSIGGIPEKYLTKEIIDNYLKNGGTVRNIPENLLTQEMCDKYIKMGGSVKIVPKKFQTLGMWTQYLLDGGNDSSIPAIFRTQELFNQYIEKNGEIKRVPKEFLNNELYKKYIELGGTLKNIPHIYNRDKIDSENKINEELLYKLKEYFETTSRSEISKVGMREFMGVSDFALTKFLQSIEEKNAQLYDEIKGIFQANSKKQYYKGLENANSIEEILKTIDFNHELNNNQKIYFSYLYDQLNIKQPMIEIYKMMKGRKDVPKFLEFCEREFGYKYSKLKDDEISLLDEEKFLLKNKDNWFRKFNEKERIGNEGKKSLKYIYLTKYNDQVEIKKDTAAMIIDYLKENNVSNRVCVVEEAFRRYANGELNDFVYELQSGEYLNINSEGIRR